MKHINLHLISALLLQCSCGGIAVSAFHHTAVPPLLDVPVFSLSTVGDGDVNDLGSSTPSTMNILTYASPISIKPQRMWSISLYKGTLSHENFARERRGVLQMLRPEHANCSAKGAEAEAGELIRVLGGRSGREVDKRKACADLGYEWEVLPEVEGGEADNDNIEWPPVLPSCLYYLKLELVGDLIDCGSHEVACCKVLSTISGEEINNAAKELDSLSTRKLRDMSIISELGRVIQVDE